ncbi:MAG TPA: homoserine O-succinyltransferase [Alteromonas australica]|jgi:homoserine O-succinyltransferase/O-acetyltransferase|uniref:Homoserine O-succinyltransferase n=1 Tax=Alteromonas australica TaxID=589873 RepID=A0A350P5E0_9ALTE|nr:homoserine O-succinyltransferase [Alteromonas australica]HAW76507.1 homoserine O-succinyltransferase [Alteromonas australica]|tara:strand:- start:3838 stop:4776 length:939 start_codon:yes stop_codon:yes gene_type:complete
MPIRIPDQLPAQDVLLGENIFTMESDRAANQDIRPLEVGILNLMPNKIETEVQLLRLLSNTPLQINVDLIRIDNQAPKNTPQSHMDAFYHDFSQVADKKYDGLIVTGAPLALLNYEDVNYWASMTTILEWAQRHVNSTLYLCWAAHAAMYHFHGVMRELKKEKFSGVFEHQVLDPNNELLRGFDPTFFAPHSRYGHIDTSVYNSIDGLNVVASSQEVGAYVVASEDKRMVFVTGHPEYDPDTLKDEYLRDLQSGQTPKVPANYFQQDNPNEPPMVRWRSHGSLLFTNWLNYFVYQTTPYDLNQLAEKPQPKR